MNKANEILDAKSNYKATRTAFRFRIRLLFFNFHFLLFTCRVFAAQPLVGAVESVGLTVSDMDRSVEFFTHVLSFEKVSDVEVAGARGSSSPASWKFPEKRLGFAKGFLARDPDGHAIQLIEK